MGDWFPKQTVGSLPERAAARWGAREALCFQGRRWSFAELSAGVERLARGLIALGVRPGEKVALWMVNRPEFLEAMFAVIKIGAVLVPINTRLRTDDTAYILGQSDSAALLIADHSGPVDYLGMVKELAPSLRGGAVREERFKHLRLVVSAGEAPHPETVHWTAVHEAGDRISATALRARAAEVDPDATAFFMYTSGTTGFPKGAMHDHAIVRNLVDRAFRMAVTPADTIMMYLPLFHLFGFSDGALMSMLTGARQVLTESFDPAESLALIEQERATILHGFDTHFKELMEAHERFHRDVSSVRTGILATGMSSSVPIARKARKVLGRFLSGYGMSEFGVGAALSALDSTEEQCCEASGFPAPGYEIRVVDPATGADQPAGTPGEILVRSYMTMQGYYAKPAETAQALDRDGWLHSGDMGVMRADGHLRFMGRYKDMLKIGGENVDPMEVEAFLMSLAGVNLAAVVSFPDARLSEVGVAFVRREPGHPVTDGDVLAQCKGRIASFKIPRHVIFIDDFPMTSSGKIQKVKLREEALKRLPSA